MPAPHTRAIEIDLQVHRAIEAQRTAFTQTENDILRQVFNITESSTPPLPHDPAESPRRTGRYAFVLLGDGVEERSLKAAYMSCLRKLADLEPRILERLAGKPTRARRIVARKASDLYLRKPELAEKFAARLTGPWWVDTNLSRQQCEKRLRTACEVAGLKFGSDLVLDFPD